MLVKEYISIKFKLKYKKKILIKKQDLLKVLLYIKVEYKNSL